MPYYPDWNCPKCNYKIFGTKNTCYKCNVDRKGNTINAIKIGDWNCPKCGDYQFARNNNCRKCNTIKPGITTGINNYLPTKPSIITPRDGDWKCPKCYVNVFASRDKCFKCQTPKPQNTDNENKNDNINTEKTINSNEDNLCSICLDQPNNMLLLHESGTEGHKCCCQNCANSLIGNNQSCPICRQKITQAIKVY